MQSIKSLDRQWLWQAPTVAPPAGATQIVRQDSAAVSMPSDGSRWSANQGPCAFLTWGSPPKVFKGFDARSLGELFLAGGP